MSDRLHLAYTPTGRNGSVTLTAFVGESAVAAEKVDILRPKSRDDFAARLVRDCPSVSRSDLDAGLLRIAAECADAQTAAPEPTADDGPLRIVRPERICTPEVCGVSLPTVVRIGDKLDGRWFQYLHWSDGRRECIPLAPSIGLPEGRLFISPVPADPAPGTAAAWSATSRAAWVAGADAPDPADVFRRLLERIAYFIDLPPESAAGTTATLALWILLTYVYHVFHAVPYLHLGGPLGSGKSRVLEVLERLVFRAFVTSSTTGPALFRTLHDRGGTLLLDEAERLRENAPDVGELRSMLLAGYKRGGRATRLEPVGDGFRTIEYDVFGPKVLACIAGLPPALASRCVPLIMFRSAADSPKPRRRIDADPAGWQSLRDDLHILALEHADTWLTLPDRTEVCPAMSGRNFELWQPLMALAAWLDEAGAGGLLSLVQEHAGKAIESASDDATPDADATLLRLLADAVRRGDRPTAGDILTAARESDGTTYRQWTPRGVTARFKSYGVPTPAKSNGRREYRVPLPRLQEIQTRYGIDLDLPHGTDPDVTTDP